MTSPSKVLTIGPKVTYVAIPQQSFTLTTDHTEMLQHVPCLFSPHPALPGLCRHWACFGSPPHWAHHMSSRCQYKAAFLRAHVLTYTSVCFGKVFLQEGWKRMVECEIYRVPAGVVSSQSGWPHTCHLHIFSKSSHRSQSSQSSSAVAGDTWALRVGQISAAARHHSYKPHVCLLRCFGCQNPCPARQISTGPASSFPHQAPASLTNGHGSAPSLLGAPNPLKYTWQVSGVRQPAHQILHLRRGESQASSALQ